MSNPIIKDQLAILEDRTRQVVRKQRTAIICDGPPGVGKTYCVQKVCHEEGKKMPEPINTTAGGLVQVLYQYRDSVVVAFDDFDKALRNEATANIVKAATAPDPVRRITHQTVTAINNQAKRNPKEHIAPPSFVLRCGLVMLTNVDLTYTKAIDRKMRDHVEALKDRMQIVHLSRVRKDIGDYCNWLALNTPLLPKHGINLSKEALHEVLDFFNENIDYLETVSIRRLLSIAKDRPTMPDRWRALQGVPDHDPQKLRIMMAKSRKNSVWDKEDIVPPTQTEFLTRKERREKLIEKLNERKNGKAK